MSQRLLVFLMLASLFLARGLHASDFYYTKRVSIPEGLSQPNVTCIQTDSKGAVWIGTRYGLNAFRAGSIHHYLDKGGSNPPVSGNFVNCIFEDSAHRLWVGTTTALSLLDRKSDSFTRKLSHPVYAIAEIDGKIYFGGRGHMSRYNPSTGSFEEIPINDGAARRDIIVYMCPIRPGIIFVALKHGTTMWLDTASFRVINSMVVHRADCIFLTGCRTSSGRIYLSAYREGLVEVSSKGRIVKTWSPENSQLTNNIILA
ncbi:MAG: two-component regulator propeller domain-containing protein, partial [Prevotella sp.]